MIATSQSSNLTPEEYLQSEETSDIKHEYIDDKIRPMSDVDDVHVTIAGNISFLLLSHL